MKLLMKLWTKKAAATALPVFCLLAFSLGLPSIAKADLPDGIIALSSNKMSFPEAEKFCREQGGRLPLVDGADFLEGYYDDKKEQVTIDGFSNIGAPWPEGLPHEVFWSGTKGAEDNPDLVYLLSPSPADKHVRAEIFYEINYKKLKLYAACVPSGNANDSGDLVITGKDQAAELLKEALDGEVPVYKGEGEIGGCKAWFFDIDKEKIAVNERGEVWGKDEFGKWVKL